MKLHRVLKLVQGRKELDLTLLSARQIADLKAALKTSSLLARKDAVVPLHRKNIGPKRHAISQLRLRNRDFTQKVRIHHPEGGRVRRPGVPRRGIGSRRHFSAMANIVSTTESGVLQARLVDRERLRAVQVQSTVESQPIRGLFWNNGGTHQSYFEFTVDPATLPTFVFMDAYIGDFRELVFVQTKIVTASTDCVFVESGLPLPMKTGSNLVAHIRVPAGLQQLMPGDLVLYGHFVAQRTMNASNVDFRTAPHFTMTLGHFTVANCFIGIRTWFDTEIWDAYASLNGTLHLFGAVIPVSSDLPVQGGLLSCNLETTECPLLQNLAALLPLANNAAIFDAWGPQAVGFLQQITQYRLTRLNIMYDAGQPGLVSVAFRIRSGNTVTVLNVSPRVSVTLTTFSLDWLVGFMAGQPVITTSGKGLATISPLDGVVWEVSLMAEPEFCIRCWATANQLPIERLAGWLTTLGELNAVAVAQYSGCVVDFYANRLEVYIGDDQHDSPRVFPKG
jgi:hypothetical protein